MRSTKHTKEDESMNANEYITYRVWYTDENGDLYMDFMEYDAKSSSFSAERAFDRRLRREIGGHVLKCDAWFE